MTGELIRCGAPAAQLRATRLAQIVTIALTIALSAACNGGSDMVAPRFKPAAGVLLATGVDSTTGASVSTNKDDYTPGEIVHVTGAGWAPGETVHLNMTEEPETHDDVSMDVTADDTGAFSVHFYDVQEHDLGVTFTLTATGATSGSTATVTFTDGNVKFITSPANLVAAITFDRYNSSNSCTGVPSGTGQVLAYNTNLGLQATQSILVTIPTVSGYAYSSVTSGGLTITQPSATTLCVQGLAGSASGTFTLNYVIANTAPVLAAIGSKVVNEEVNLGFTATATDDGNPNPPGALSFSLGTPSCGTPVPGTATISSGGAFSWTPTEAEGPGSYCALIVVSDGALSDSEEITITVNEVASPPDLAAVGNKTVDELTLLSFAVSATDPDGGTLTFSLATPASGTYPAGAGLAGNTFNWTPTEVQGPGVYRVKVVVTDPDNNSDEEEIQITVNEVNVAPVLDAIGNQSGDELTNITFTATASDADLPANSLAFSLGTPSCGNPVPGGAGGATITPGGVFSWTPTEAQGPGVYCALIVVSDGALSDSEEITITVNEVNLAPVLTVPANVVTQWGVALGNLSATATDADLPANSLTFSLQSGPGFVTVAADGTISFSAIGAADVGAHTVTVNVTDNGSPSLSDSESFTITVQNRPTALAYDGKSAGQYSDKSTLSATLKDNGIGPLNGTAIAGETIDFTFNSGAAGSDATDASGQASVLYQVLSAAGSYTVAATYTGANGYSGSSDSKSFTVSKESAEFTNVAFTGSVPVSQTSFSITASVRELRIAGVEPNPNDGAMPGDIGKVTNITAKIAGVSSNATYNGTCGAGSGGSSSYASTQNFTCNFSGGPFVVDAYTLTLDVVVNSYYVALTHEDALSVWDPNAGFANGGGSFTLGGDRVTFGFSYTQTKGKTTPRSGFVVVRHMATGGVCRLKSNNQMNAPAVKNNTATLSGKGNYSCVDGLGNTTASQGNINISAYAEDNGTSGAGQDKFWVSNAAAVSPNYLKMPAPASANAALLTGGNVQVPQPKTP